MTCGYAGTLCWIANPAAGVTRTSHSAVPVGSTPATGYFPLAPWAGFAVLCAWTALALALAAFLLSRRDA